MRSRTGVGGTVRGPAPTVAASWVRMPRWQQAGVVVLAAAEIVLTTRAAADLVRRPKGEVRGPKSLWWAGFTVQPFGPIAYLSWGRRH